MLESSATPLPVEPVLTYPRQAQVGQTYLVTVDLRPQLGFETWPYRGSEEMEITCRLQPGPFFTGEPLGAPVVVLHRFGGSYGPARFLLHAGPEIGDSPLRVTLLNRWGLPLSVLETPAIHVQREPVPGQALSGLLTERPAREPVQTAPTPETEKPQAGETPVEEPAPDKLQIPVFSIVSVARDRLVTIFTENFPANDQFEVRMGPMGSKGIDGILVDTVDSIAGGQMVFTFQIPAQFYGANQIAIRLQSPTSGYYSYNWFYNSANLDIQPSFAMVIGISEYPNAPALPSAVESAREFLDDLMASAPGKSPAMEAVVLLNSQATVDAIIKTLEQARRRMASLITWLRDMADMDAPIRFIFYFAGYGHTYADESRYIYIADLQPSRPELVDLKQLMTLFTVEKESSELIAWFDAAERPFEIYNPLLLPPSPNPRNFNTFQSGLFGPAPAQGLFTRALLEGLGGAAADSGRFVNASNLLRYMGEQVPRLGQALGISESDLQTFGEWTTSGNPLLRQGNISPDSVPVTVHLPVEWTKSISITNSYGSQIYSNYLVQARRLFLRLEPGQYHFQWHWGANDPQPAERLVDILPNQAPVEINLAEEVKEKPSPPPQKDVTLSETFRILIIQAFYGDCMILVNETGKNRRCILVDGGPGRIYAPYLRPELEKIAAQGGKLDLVVLTHVDDSHAMGLLEMMEELRKASEEHLPPVIQVGGIWHNSFSKILPEAPESAAELEQEMLATPLPTPAEPDQAAPSESRSDAVPPESETDQVSPPASEAGVESPEANLWGIEAVSFSVRRGHQLQLLDAQLGIPRNAGFPDGLIQLETAARPIRAAGMRLWILGPSKANLEMLREKWFKELKQANFSFGTGPAALKRDTGDIKPTAPKPDTGGITPKLVKPDTSITNLSSIMFLAESGGRRILMTGDGLGDDIVTGLEQVGLLAPGETFHVDILKLPHKGSARNSVGQLFDRVQADTYVISADGHYNHPNRQTLDWLVDAASRQGRDITIVATNPTPSLQQFQVERPPEQNHYRLIIMPSGTGSLEL